MRTSTVLLLVAAVSSPTAVWGAWNFYRSFDPIPTELRTVAGKATNVRTSTLLYSKSHATFLLEPSTAAAFEVSYKPRFRRFYYFAENLRNGMQVEITLGPGGIQDIWGLTLESKTLMTPAEAHDAQKTEGLWGLGLFVAFLGTTAWLTRLAITLRRKGH